MVKSWEDRMIDHNDYETPRMPKDLCSHCDTLKGGMVLEVITGANKHFCFDCLRDLLSKVC